MYCTKCGSAIADGQRFCGACGAPAVVPVMPEAATAPVAPPAPPPPPAAPIGIAPAAGPLRQARPTAVVVIATLQLVIALLLLLSAAGFFSFLISGPNFRITPAILAVLAGLVLVVVAAVVSAIGLMNMRPYGRALALPFAWFGLLLFPLGTIVSIFLLLYLLRPETVALFQAPGGAGDGVKPGPWPMPMKVFAGFMLVSMLGLAAIATIRRMPNSETRAADFPVLEIGILSEDGQGLIPDVDNLTAQDVAEVSLVSAPEGMPEVQFRFTASGSSKMERLSSEHVGSRMAIVVDGEIDTAQAAVIHSPLSEHVSMTFTSVEEARQFVDGMSK